MKLRQSFILVLFLAIVGILAIGGQAYANQPAIKITYVGIPKETLEIRGNLVGTEEQPELLFTFIKPSGPPIELEVPLLETNWSAEGANGSTWMARLDLSDIPDGFYHVLLSATLDDGTRVSDMLTGDPGHCTSGVCVPSGGFGESSP